MCVGGPSGCGKTTLLLALRGLLKRGRQEGALVRVCPGSESDIGLVFQNIESQVLLTPVEDDVAFGPQNRGYPPGEVALRVGEALDDVGLQGFEKRNVSELSAGEKQRLGMASALAAGPRALFLDEPTAQLDRRGKARLLQILRGLKTRGVTLLVAEHDLEPFVELADRFLQMEEGRIICVRDCFEPQRAGGRPAAGGRENPPRLVDEGPPILFLKGLQVDGPAGPVFRGLDLEIRAGERIHLYGENGAGKSTLLRCIAGLRRPDAGTVQVRGVGNHRSDRLLGKIALLLQNPEKQLFEENVQKEIGFSLLRMKLPEKESAARVMESAALCGVTHLLDRPPLGLSLGEQHRVALASVMAMHPSLLLLDEPFAGIDFGERRRLLNTLTDYRNRWQTAVLIASHDDLPAVDWAERRLEMKGGRLESSPA